MNTAAIRLTGVGCFARGITLARVLRRMMAAYSLGNFGAVDGFRNDTSPAVQALQNLISGGSGSSAQVNPDWMGEEVAGFFLNFDNESLNLSVFTRSRGRPCRKYTASLEELTRLRHSRLH